MSLDHTKSAIVVFAMDGCGACEDFMPRFERLIAGFQAHGQPLVYYQIGMPLTPGAIPVIVLDADSTDESVVSFADQHAIDALPTTLLLRRNAKPARLEGAVDDKEIYDALVSACIANR